MKKIQRYSAFEAISQAQKIAFAPMVFQATVIFLRRGIFALLEAHGKTGGLTAGEVSKQAGLSLYAATLLLDVGESAELVYSERSDGEKHYFLSKIGFFFLHDKMTQANLNFTQDVCYQGLYHLNESFSYSRPEGLKVFGDWDTIYPALSQLPQAAQKSWFEFDHYYSDGAYAAALPHVFELKPAVIYDVGGNTGKFSLKCCAYNSDVQMCIVDLPEQIELARANIEAQAAFADRIDYHAANMLDESVSLPEDADVWWMSQFLDCFSREQIVSILRKIKQQLKPGARVCILELFPDVQRFEAAEFSLNMSSLYFTCMANGNSRFYESDVFLECIQDAGLVVEKLVNELGVGHSLLICRHP